MSLFNLQLAENTLSIEPYLENRRKGIQLLLPALLMAVASYVVPRYFPEKPELEIALYVFAVLLIGWALYRYAFKSKTRIEFNKKEDYVYKIHFGLYRSKLIKISKIHTIDGIVYNGALLYCITSKNDRFGKNYPISNYFYGESTERTEFENVVLLKIDLFLEKNI